MGAGHVFVVPPGWPQPPDGWVPPAGWSPDPSWPAPPPGWQFWRSPETKPETKKAFGGKRKELEAEVEALQIFVAGAREENTRLTQRNAVLQKEMDRLAAAVEASNTELRRILGL